MKNLRKIVFWLHLISGVAAGIFIFLMCVTGAILAFQPDILALAESSARKVERPSPDAQRVPVAEILTRIQAAKPQTKPSAILVENDENAAVTVQLGRDGNVFANPYTGEITGSDASGWRAFFRINTDLHRWLAFSGDARPVGKWLNDAANLLFLVLAISGVYIWFPRRFSLNYFAPIIWFRRTQTARARDFNWHNVIGFWTSSVLVVLTLTGVIISYQWAGNLLYTLTGNEVPAQSGGGEGRQNNAPPAEFKIHENIDAAFFVARSRGAWKSISLRLPVTSDTAAFTIDEGIYWNRFGRSNLSVNLQTVAVAKWEPYGELNAARQLRSWARFTHTGETGGFVGRLVGFIACVGGAVLVYTGFALAWRRFRNWRKSSVTNQPASL